MHFDELLDDRQTDAQAALSAGRRMVDLVEEIKRLRQLFWRDADSGILDPDDDVGALIQRRRPYGAAILAVLGGVVQQVDDDLLETGEISIDPKSKKRRSVMTCRGAVCRTTKKRSAARCGSKSIGCPTSCRTDRTRLRACAHKRLLDQGLVSRGEQLGVSARPP